MKAANWEAQDRGLTVGCKVVLPTSNTQTPNLGNWVVIPYFFYAKYPNGSNILIPYIVMQGENGLMGEYFERPNLIQTGKIGRFTVIIIDQRFRLKLTQHITFRKEKVKISGADRQLFLITDLAEEAVKWIKEISIAKFGLRYKAHTQKMVAGRLTFLLNRKIPLLYLHLFKS